jgi:hypothetical protein
MALPVLTKRRSRKPRTVTIELPPALELERVEAETPPPALSPRLRIAREPDGVAIWNDELFTDSAGQQLRGFLSRVFSLPEILAVEINRKAGVGRLKYGLSEDVPAIWRKLKQVLIEPATTHRDRDDEIRSEYRAGALGVDLLYLDGPASLPIRIGRVGSYLST